MKHKIGYNKLGAMTFIIAGILFFAQYLFLLPVPHPPLTDADLVNWLVTWKLNLAMSDELFIFATLFLIPSIVALYRILVKKNKLAAMVGCGLLAVTIPINAVLDIVFGRLVYPVYNINLSPDIYRLVLSIYYGGMHSVAMIMCVATIILCFSIRKTAIGKFAAYLGFLVGILDLFGAYPWLLGTVMVFVTQLFYCAWFVIVGIRILLISEELADEQRSEIAALRQ